MVDTSALTAVVLNEAQADACERVLSTADVVLISAGTLLEVLIVAKGRNIREEMEHLITGIGCEVVPVTEADAMIAASAYAR